MSTRRFLQSGLGAQARLDADILAADLAAGKSLEQISRDRGWRMDRVRNRLAVLQARDVKRLAPHDPQAVFGRFVSAARGAIDGAQVVKNQYMAGPEDTTVTTTINQDDPTTTVTHQVRKVARNGVSAGEYLTAGRDAVKVMRDVIEVGQALGVYPAAPKEAPVSQVNINQTIGQVIQAIRVGGDALEHLADGRTVNLPMPVIDVPSLDGTDDDR